MFQILNLGPNLDFMKCSKWVSKKLQTFPDFLA